MINSKSATGLCTNSAMTRAAKNLKSSSSASCHLTSSTRRQSKLPEPIRYSRYIQVRVIHDMHTCVDSLDSDMRSNAFDVLPTEIIEHIGRTPVKIFRSEQLLENELVQAVLEAKTLHSLTLVDRRFNRIFTPFLYHQVVLKSTNSIRCFSSETLDNAELCGLVNILFFSGRTRGSRFTVDSHDASISVLAAILPELKQLKTLRLGKFRGDEFRELHPWDLKSSTHLRDIELYDSYLPLSIHQALEPILPNIQRFVISNGSPWSNISKYYGYSFSGMMRLKSFRIHSTRFNFETAVNSVISKVTAEELEELEFDSTIPYSKYMGPYQFISIGSLDRWKDTLKVFRFRGDPIEVELKKYLDTVLENCEVVEIVEIPVEIGQGHSLNMWMG